MKFDLDNLNPGVKFDFTDGNPKDGTITLRVCNGVALDEIRRKCTKKRSTIERGQRVERTETDETMFSNLMWDYCIVDWFGMEDAKGKPIPCNVDTKSALMRGSVMFSRRVSELLDRLSEEIETAKGEAEKN